jgi:hypothetical protein
MDARGEKLGGGPVDQSVDMLGIVSGAHFFRSSRVRQLCWVSIKGFHIRGLPMESVCVMNMDQRKKCTCRVYQVFPYRVYIDSNRHDSRI